MRVVTRERAVAYRLGVNHLIHRLPAGAHEQAAYVGLQDTAPRDALLGLHARMAGCGPDDWAHRSFVQTYSPRAAVYVLPARDFGVFTLGRLPLDQDAVRRIDGLAERVCAELDGTERRGAGIRGLREACASGRIAVRWDTTSLYAREVPRPDVDVPEARRELCRRHVQYFGPTTPKVFAWWSGLSPADARAVWDQVADELVEVDFDGVPGWVRRADEERLWTADAPRGVRLLVASDLRLFGRDRDGRFIAPGLRRLTAAADTFHPNGLLVDGRITGAPHRAAPVTAVSRGGGRRRGSATIGTCQFLPALVDKICRTPPAAGDCIAVRRRRVPRRS